MNKEPKYPQTVPKISPSKHLGLVVVERALDHGGADGEVAGAGVGGDGALVVDGGHLLVARRPLVDLAAAGGLKRNSAMEC